MTRTPIRLGIIGLGAMGTRMLQVALAHPSYAVTHASDLDPATVSRFQAGHPDVVFSTTPADVLGADVDAVYVATPPATHAAYVVPALEAGKAVFCEKPLAISAADAEAMVAAADGRATAVNFALSDQQATQYVEKALADGRVGDVLGVEIRLHFPEWPRKFQAGATWIDGREQGGFVREVFSHFAYLTDRLLGPLEPVHVELGFGRDDRASERTAYGLLRAGDVPVQLIGSAGAPGPTTYEWILRGTNQSYLLRDWRDLFVANDNEWTRVDLPPEDGSERLTLFAALMNGTPSPNLATFTAAQRVQHAVEAFHSR